MKYPSKTSFASYGDNLSILLAENIRDSKAWNGSNMEFDSFMGKINVFFRTDGSIRYDFFELDSKKKFRTPLDMALANNPPTRIDQEVYVIYLQSCYYKLCHPKTSDDLCGFRASDGRFLASQDGRSPNQLANQTPFLNLIFSRKGILDDDLKLDRSLVADVYQKTNFIQYLFFDANLAQIFSNHIREDLKELDENTKKDLVKSILNFKKGVSIKPLFNFVKNVKIDSSELGIVINDLIKTQSQDDDRLEVLKEITNHRDENSSFLEFLLEKNQYKPIKRLIGIASEILTSESRDVKDEIEEIFDLKRLFSSSKTLNLLNKEHCENLFEIFDLIQDPLQKKQYFEEVFLANNEAFIKKMLNQNKDDILSVFMDKIKEIYDSRAAEDFIEKSKFRRELKRKILDLPRQDDKVMGVKRRRLPSSWDCAPKSSGIDEDRIGVAIAFPITATPETSKDKQAKSFNPSQIPDDPFDRPMTSPLVRKITINISSSTIKPK